MICGCYYRFLAHYPLVVVLIVFLILSIALTGTFVRSPEHWFAGKDEGFMPIGTPIQKTVLAIKQIQEYLHRGTLSYTPYQRDVNGAIIIQTRSQRPSYVTAPRNVSQTMADWITKCQPWRPIGTDRVKLVLDVGDVLNTDYLRAVCQLDDDFILPYPGVNRTCPSISLGTYVGLIERKPCSMLRYQDIVKVKQLLLDCEPHYTYGNITADCHQDQRRCAGVPVKCLEYNAVFNILTYLVDKNFLHPPTGQKYTQLTLVHLPIYKNQMTLASQFVRSMVESGNLESERYDIVGVDLGDNYAVMIEYGHVDLIQSSMIIAIIVVILWFYMRSFTLLATLFLCLALTVSMTFFVYSTVLRISLFAPVNLCASVVFLMHCVNGSLVLSDIWQRNKTAKPNSGLEERVANLFRKGLFPLFVTHVTSSVALWANLLNSIQLISGFAIFSGMGVLFQLSMKLSLFPAVLVLNEGGVKSLVAPCCTETLARCCSKEVDTSDEGRPSAFRKFRQRFRQNFSKLNQMFSYRFIPSVVINARYLWIVVLTALGIFGMVYTFENTRLRPPVLPTDLRVHHPKTLLGNYYDLQTRFYAFLYSQNVINNPDSNPVNMTVQLMFGLVPNDHTNWLSLQHDTSIVVDRNFDFYHPRTLEWLHKHCHLLREEAKMIGEVDLEKPCMLDHFTHVLARKCDEASSTKCCDRPVGHFPYQRDVISQCFTSMLAQNSSYDPNSFIGRPIFNQSNYIVAFIYEFTTRYRLSIPENDENNVFKVYAVFQKYMKSSLQGAPTGLDSAWLFSELTYLDLTTTIAAEMPLRLAILIGCAVAAMLFTSVNLILTIFFALSLTFTTCITTGALSLLGWQLGIQESALLSMVVALSAEFPAHYVAAYWSAAEDDRKLKCQIMYESVSSSAFVTLLTLLLCGSILYTSRIYPCYQIGQFIFIYCAAAWIYANFFLPSLLATFGPIQKFCWSPCKDICCPKPQETGLAIRRRNENGAVAFEHNIDVDIIRTQIPIDTSVAIIGTPLSEQSSPTLCGRAFKKKRYKRVSLKDERTHERLAYQVTCL